MSPGECRAGLVFLPPPVWGFTSWQGELGSGGWVLVVAWPHGVGRRALEWELLPW